MKNLFWLSGIFILSIFSFSVSFAEQNYQSFLNGFYVYDIEVADNADNYVWCGTDRGVVKFNSIDNTYRVFTTEDSLLSNQVRSIDIGGDGKVWAACSGTTDSSGICVYDGIEWKKYPTINFWSYYSDTYYHYFSVATDSKSGAFAGDYYSRHQWVNHNMFRFDGNDWMPFIIAGELVYPQKTCPGEVLYPYPPKIEINQNDVTYSAGYIFENNITERIVLPEYFPGVRSISSDRNGNFWFGSNFTFNSVFMFDRTNWYFFKGPFYNPDGKFTGPPVTSIAAQDSTDIWVGIPTGNLYRYHNEKWSQCIKGEEWTHYIDEETSLAIGSDGIVWFGSKRGLDKYNPLIANVEKNFEVPIQYKLFENYPNPFNPSTTISYSIPESGHITLDVYSISGQKVASLVNSFVNAGKHEVIFDGSGLSSGVYLYRFEAGGFSKSGRMLLMK